MKSIKKHFYMVVSLLLACSMLLGVVSCGRKKPVKEEKEQTAFLLNGFDSMDDLYRIKPIDTQATDVMQYSINTEKNYIKNGAGSLRYEDFNGSYHGILLFLEKTVAANADIKTADKISASVFNASNADQVVSVIATAQSGATLFIQQNLLKPQEWNEVVLDLTQYSYENKSQIAGVELRFDVDASTVLYVDDWYLYTGAEDLPPLDLNKYIESIKTTDNEEEVTEENFDKYVLFVDQVRYAANLFNELDEGGKNQITAQNQTKLTKCLQLVKNINLVNDARTTHLTKWYYGSALTVFQNDDAQYGGVWSANVPKTNHEQSFKFDISDTSASGKVVFWVYNPMSENLRALLHGGWQLWAFQTEELPAKSWKKIEVNARYFEQDIKGQIFIVVSGADAIEGEFKFTSLYGISADVVAKPVVDEIAKLPKLSDVDYSYRKQVEEILLHYADLSEAAQAAVSNYDVLDDIYKKIMSLRLPEMRRLLASLDVGKIVLPRDYTNIDNAITIYDELPDSEKAKVTAAEKNKLNALKTKIKDYGRLYGEAVENGIDYVWQGTAVQKYDKLYGNYTELNVKKTNGTAQFVDRLVEVDPKEYAQVIFYVYNPTDKDVTAEYSHNWNSNQTVTLKKKAWTEVTVNTVDYAHSVNFMLFYSDIACTSPWKMTDLYGVKANVVAEPVIKKINALPNASSITMKDFDAISEARLTYDSLQENVKPSVTNYKKLLEAENKLALKMIDSLPVAANAEMPRDYTNIMRVKTAYDRMSAAEKSKITAAQKNKLTALFKLAANYENIYSDSLESGFDYKWSGDITRKVDPTYGNYTALTVKSTEKGMAQFADKMLKVASRFDKVEFYIYNPTAKDVVTEYSHNWKNSTAITLKAKAWTKVSLKASDYSGVINLFAFYSDISCKDPWKITDYYGLLGKSVAQEMIDLINTIPKKLTAADNELLLNLRRQYNALSKTVQSQVTNYSKLVTAEKKMVALMIDALPDAKNSEMPRDYTNVMNAKRNYDKLSATERSAISAAQKNKLNALVEKASNYADIYSATLEPAYDYKWTGNIKKSVDPVYGNMTELLVKSTESGMAQFADRLLTVNSDKYVYVEFYIYNPTAKDVIGEYTHNWNKTVSVNLKSKAWTKVRIPAEDYAGTINFINFYTDISCKDAWKVTDLYGVTGKAIAQDCIDLINTIPAKLTADDNELLSLIRQKYDALPAAAQKAVSNYSKLVTAEKKMVAIMIDALPDVDASEMPRDYTNVMNVKRNYDKLSVAERASISAEQKEKLEALFEKASCYDDVYSSAWEHAFDYKWSGDIERSVDAVYGNLTALTVKSTESGMAQFADRLLKVDSKYLYVEFYVYNPMDKDIPAEYTHNWKNTVSLTFKSKAWTKVCIPAADYQGNINFINFYTDISCKDAWKVTDLYGLKSEAVADTVSAQIDALPSVEDLTLEDKATVESVKKTYDELPTEIKALVKNDGKLTALLEQIKVLEKAEQKTYPIIIDPAECQLDADGTVQNNMDDETFEKVFALSNASYFTVDASLMTEDYKACNTVFFYVYNPTSKDVNGYFVSDYDWSYMPSFLAKANAWSRIEIKDFGAATGKQLISAGYTIYFNGSFNGDGWKISPFYGITENTAEDVVGLNTLIDWSSGKLETDGSVTNGVSDADFGTVAELSDGTFFKLNKNLMTDAFKTSSYAAFYIYNPTSTDIDGYYTTDWSFNANFRLKANSWNRVTIADFGTAANKKMLSGGKDIYFYGAFTGTGWKISPVYQLDHEE